MKKEAGTLVQANCAMDILLSKFQTQTSSARAALTAAFPSVFSIATGTMSQLLESDPLLHISTARELRAASIAMTTAVARRFREQRLTAAIRKTVRRDNGVLGLLDTPTYSDMFNPDWASHCPPDAIEATTSPVAYLADLYREVEVVERMGDMDRIIPLATRRPDLASLLLDHTALNRVEPTLVLVNEILEKSIRAYLDGISLPHKSVDDAMLEVRYPFTLPYERYQQQINYVLNRRERLPGDPIRAIDPAYPYFKEPGVHSLLSDIALIQDSGLGPVQQGLLVESPYAAGAGDAGETKRARRINPRNGKVESRPLAINFFKDNYGIDDILALTDTQTFCLRTGLTTDQLDSLLSVGPYMSSLSDNVAEPEAEIAVDGAVSGSIYINAGVSPAVSIESSEEDGVPVHRLIDTSMDRFDRMNRMIRLAGWLQLPFDQVDQLLAASHQAEQRAANIVRRQAAPVSHLITQDTLRAIGLFQRVRTRYDVPAEDFAAMLYGLSVYARGKTPSQFDRVFNSQAMFSIPLILDGSPFVVTPRSEDERQKIDHLCAALGMTYEMYRFVAKVVEQSWASQPLCWNRETVSAFYRLVRLPRYLGLTTIEALALLELLDGGGSQLTSRLAGIPQIATYHASANTDTLSVIHALVDCAAWLQDSNWTVAQLCGLVMPALTRPVATDTEHGLLQRIHSRLNSALINDNSFAQAGAPDSSLTLKSDDLGMPLYVNEPIDWFAELERVIDTGAANPAARGLVKYLPDETEEEFEQTVSREVSWVLDSLGLPVEELHAKITNMIMRARGAQEALLMEGLAAYLGTSADQGKALLFWSKGNRYQLLLEVLRVYGADASASVAIGDEVLLVLDALSKRAVVSEHLTLSPALITQYVEHPEWFGVRSTELSMQTVYFLTRYATVLRMCEQSEDTLLDYFRLINTLWQGAGEGDRRLIHDSAASKLAGFLDWGVRDVIAVAWYLCPETGVIFTLREFDVLARVSQLAKQSRLDANALLALHKLTPTTSTEGYRRAAELALSSLTESSFKGSVGEVGQSHSSVITVTPDYLVAQRELETAIYTITLRDLMDEPLSDVTVSWTTDLGELQEYSSITDDQGQASVILHGGEVMGLVHVVAEYGLGDRLMAPVVVIDCDEGSLRLVEGEHSPSTALSNNKEAIYYSVALVDTYGNRGIDRTIEWTSTLGEFTRFRTYTNQQGITEAELRSRPAGESVATAHYQNGDDWEFAAVEFVSIPYFQYVRFNNTVVANVETEVVCSLVELDGTPVVGKEVTWADDAGGLLEVTTTTDERGIAVARFKTASEGQVVVTVSAGDPIRDKVSAPTTIHEAVVIDRSEASGTEYHVGSTNSLFFSVWLKAGNQPAKRFPVEWSIDDSLVTTSQTDIDGRAVFSSTFDIGRHIVKAAVGGSISSVEFPVSGILSCEFSITDEGDVDVNNPNLLGRERTRQLRVKVVGSDQNALDGVEFKLEHTPFPMVSIEGAGTMHLSSVEGTTFLIHLGGDSRYGDLEVTLSGPWPATMKKLYKVGWICDPSSAYVEEEGRVGFTVFKNNESESLSPMGVPSDFWVFPAVQNLSRNVWSLLLVRVLPDGQMFYKSGPAVYPTFDVGETIRVHAVTALGGYLSTRRCEIVVAEHQ